MTKLAINIETAKHRIAELEKMHSAYWAQYQEAIKKRDRTDLENAAATQLSNLAENCRTEADKLRNIIGEPIIRKEDRPNVVNGFRSTDELLRRIQNMQVIEV